MTQAIAALPDDYVRLTQCLGDRIPVGQGQERVSSTPQWSVPLSLPAMTLTERMVTESTRLAELVAERLHITWDSRLVDHYTRPGPALQRATHLLVAAMSVLLALPEHPVCEWGPEGSPEWVDRDGLHGALGLLECDRLARLRLGKTRLVHRLPGPCPGCDQVSLIRWDGDDHLDCQHCHGRWTEDDPDYERLSHVLHVT